VRAKLSGAVYCNRTCLSVCLWVCYHDNSKLRSSIFTKLGLYVKVVTMSSWLNFGRPAPARRESAAGWKMLAPPYCSKSAVCVRLSEVLTLLFAVPLTKLCTKSLELSGFTRKQRAFNPVFVNFCFMTYFDRWHNCTAWNVLSTHKINAVKREVNIVVSEQQS